MKIKKLSKARRVAVSLEMEWGLKRHIEVYAGCQSYADTAGWVKPDRIESRGFFSPAWDCSIQPAADRALKTRTGQVPFDGILARATPALAKAARKKGVPMVNVWLNSPVKGLPSVFADFEASGVMAAEHLLARGFRQLGYLGFLGDIGSRLQVRGFRVVTKREGFPCMMHRFLRTSMEGKARGWEAFITNFTAWVDSWKPPIGIFVSNDLYCRCLIDVCRSKGLHVPQDVAIVGTSNESTICTSPSPTLTSIDMGYKQIGYRAAAMLDRLMEGRKSPNGPELVAPKALVPRQSTDSYAADDPLVARALRFIAENSHRPIKVMDVTVAVVTNRRTLERKFIESGGRSVAVEITRLRLARAKRRLVESDASLKAVAVDSGFRNADHFYKVFARIEGYTPTQYRKKRRANA